MYVYIVYILRTHVRKFVDYENLIIIIMIFVILMIDRDLSLCVLDRWIETKDRQYPARPAAMHDYKEMARPAKP